MYLQGWRRYFDFVGVSTRTEYWTFTLINLAVGLVLILGWFLTGSTNEADQLQWNIFGYLWLAFSLVALIPGLTAQIRRVRDATGSGLWVLLWLLPIVGGIVVFVMTLMPSKQQ